MLLHSNYWVPLIPTKSLSRLMWEGITVLWKEIPQPIKVPPSLTIIHSTSSQSPHALSSSPRTKVLTILHQICLDLHRVSINIQPFLNAPILQPFQEG